MQIFTYNVSKKKTPKNLFAILIFIQVHVINSIQFSFLINNEYLQI